MASHCEITARLPVISMDSPDPSRPRTVRIETIISTPDYTDTEATIIGYMEGIRPDIDSVIGITAAFSHDGRQGPMLMDISHMEIYPGNPSGKLLATHMALGANAHHRHKLSRESPTASNCCVRGVRPSVVIGPKRQRVHNDGQLLRRMLSPK